MPPPYEEKSKGAQIFLCLFIFFITKIRQPQVEQFVSHARKTSRSRDSEVIVGTERTLEELRRCLRDDELSIIGLHGAIETGKTTLLRELLEGELGSAGADFSLLIFATVPTSGSILEALQVQIKKRLGMPADELTDGKSRSETILKQMEEERFLDVVRQEFDLGSSGIPVCPHKKDGSKVILSLRYHMLCGAQRLVRMETLTTEAARLLFQERVGVEAIKSDPDITQLDRTVARYCHDLPLALVMVGAPMAGNQTAEKWKHAIHALQSQPSVSSGLTEKGCLLFKSCCSNHWDERMRPCLLCCSILPKGHPISQDALIELWMGAGFISGYRSSFESRAEGRGVIAFMKDSGLLESRPDEKTWVMMWHQIHDTAARLLRETEGIFPDHRRAHKHSSSDSDGEEEFGKLKSLEGTRASQESSRRLPMLLELGRLGMLNSLHLGRSGQLGGAVLHAATTGSGNPCYLVGCSDDDEKAVGNWKLSSYHLLENYMKIYVGDGDAREIGNWNLSSHLGLGNCKESYFGTDDKREVENRNLFSYHELGDFKDYYFGGDDEREVGNWAFKVRGGDDEREAGNWAFKDHGGDDEREVGNWALKGHGGDDEIEAGDWELIGHDGDDEREIGNWGMIGHGGDDEKEPGNLRLMGDDKREDGSWRLIGRGGDDEREVGNWRLMRCSSSIAKELGLEDLEDLNDLRLTLNRMSSLQRLLTSNVLLTFTRFLCLKNCKGLTSAHVQSALSNLRNLWRLHINACPDLEELVIGGEGAPVNSLEIFILSNLPIRKIDISCASHIKISGLVISSCPNLKNVAFAQQLGHLEEISIIDCDQMDHLVGEKDERVVDETVDLPKLKRLTLARLPRLQAICFHKLALPSLEYLHVHQCDRLREFPFAKQSAKHLREIRDPIESWIALEKDYEIIDSAPFPSVSCTQCENLLRDTPNV